MKRVASLFSRKIITPALDLSDRPNASFVLLLGLPTVGFVVEPFWLYNSPGNVNEKQSGLIVQFERADDAIGTNRTTLQTGATKVYTVVSADNNKYIRVGVKVLDMNDLAAGDFAWGEWEKVSVYTANLFNNYTMVDGNVGAIPDQDFSLTPPLFGADSIAECCTTIDAGSQQVNSAGNGFLFQSQRVQANTSGSTMAIRFWLAQYYYESSPGVYSLTSVPILSPGKTYLISFKYRSNKQIIIKPTSGSFSGGNPTYVANTGNAVEVSFEITQQTLASALAVGLNSYVNGDWLEVGEMRIQYKPTSVTDLNAGAAIPKQQQPSYVKVGAPSLKPKTSITILGTQGNPGASNHYSQYLDAGFVDYNAGVLTIQNCKFDEIDSVADYAVVDITDWYGGALDKIIFRNCRGYHSPIANRVTSTPPPPFLRIRDANTGGGGDVKFEMYDCEIQGYNTAVIGQGVKFARCYNNVFKDCGFLRYFGGIPQDGFVIKFQVCYNSDIILDRNQLLLDLSKCYTSDLWTFYGTYGDVSNGVKITNNYVRAKNLNNPILVTGVVSCFEAKTDASGFEESGNGLVAGNVMVNVSGMNNYGSRVVSVTNNGVKILKNVSVSELHSDPSNHRWWQVSGFSSTELFNYDIADNKSAWQGNRAKYYNRLNQLLGYGAYYDNGLPAVVNNLDENSWLDESTSLDVIKFPNF